MSGCRHGLPDLVRQHVVRAEGNVLIAAAVDGERADVHQTIILIEDIAAVSTVFLGNGVVGLGTRHALGYDAEVLHFPALPGLHKF